MLNRSKNNFENIQNKNKAFNPTSTLQTLNTNFRNNQKEKMKNYMKLQKNKSETKISIAYKPNIN